MVSVNLIAIIRDITQTFVTCYEAVFYTSALTLSEGLVSGVATLPLSGVL